MFKTLYLCYFGLREPLVQTQVLPYLRELKKMDDLQVSLLTFEPNFKKTWTAQQIETEKQTLAREGIEWHALGYHKRPSVPATLYDIFSGVIFTLRLARREKIDILHARSHIPAMMAALVKRFRGGKIIFDIRGFLPEEYTDAGVWKEDGIIYKTVKFIEKRVMKSSDGFVILTEKAREILFPESKTTGSDKFDRPVEVIPCCVDLIKFDMANETSRAEIRRKYKLENRRVMVYIGSFGGWYLTDEMLDFLETARERSPQTFTLILTQRDKEKVIKELRRRNFSDEDFLVESVAPADIPKFLGASDVALSFIKACYSKQASSPTKIAEYFACGLPLISNSGVGDLDALIEGEKVGVILDGFSEKDYLNALRKIDDLTRQKNLPAHCRNISAKYFDLHKIGGENYRKLYRRLLTGKSESN